MIKKLTLLATDIVTLYSALALVLVMRYGAGEWSAQWSAHSVPFTVLFAVWLLSFYMANLYDPRALRNGRDFLNHLGQAVAVAAFLSVAFFYLIPLFITPKLNLLLFIFVFVTLVAGARTLANTVLVGGSKKQVLIVGTSDESVDLARYIQEYPQLGWSVRALVPVGQPQLDLEKVPGPWEVLDERTDLAAFIADNHIDTVVISPQAYDNAPLIDMLYGALAEQVDFASLAPFAEQLTGTVPVGVISQQWFLENIAENSKKPFEKAKRIMDIAAALLLAIPTLALTPLVALATKLYSPGPIFFRQTRTGRNGHTFEILKFRTMHTDAEKTSGAVWALVDDPRITKIGTFLRKTRLDELPQCWNILRGEMSLIGPRAERPEFDHKLSAQIPFYWERYLIKPGATGWAQINYPYGSSPIDSLRKLEYDLYYLRHRSLGLDLEIILKTISIALRREGR